MIPGAWLHLLVLAALALATLTALGWGPGTHIELSRELYARFLRRRRLNEAQHLVVDHFRPFLYGNIAADIINFKAYGGIKNHCHHWSIHERLCEHARLPHQRAFVLGYLCHLAADVVAHNHFVPYHCVFNFPPRFFGHPYWEALADSRVTDEEWGEVDVLRRLKTLREYDTMVHEAVRWRALGLRSNRWIFDNILLLSCRRRWRDLVREVDRGARKHPLDPQFHEECLQASLRNMLRVFHDRGLALLKASDPTGRSALRGSTRMRRELLRDFKTRAQGRDVASALARAAFRLR